jgi:hypothetical protein
MNHNKVSIDLKQVSVTNAQTSLQRIITWGKKSMKRGQE